MKIVQLVDANNDGKHYFVINWMMLPSFIGMNSILLKELQNILAEKYFNQDAGVTSDILHPMNVDARAFFLSKFPALVGLCAVFDALEALHVENE
jgi:hypothetical protein